MGHSRHFRPICRRSAVPPMADMKPTCAVVGEVPFATSGTAAKSDVRGRDASYLAPPAQIRTCGFPAYGSHLGY
jgi:hypothetical protein